MAIFIEVLFIGWVLISLFAVMTEVIEEMATAAVSFQWTLTIFTAAAIFRAERHGLDLDSSSCSPRAAAHAEIQPCKI